MRLHRELVDLATVADSVCRQATAQQAHRQITFAATAARAVAGDEDTLRQLLWILVDNAVKFTSAGGGIWVAVTQRGDRVVLTVADDGVGIPLGSEVRIFDRFHRATSGATNSAGGAGLGLAIADSIVRATNGRWRVGASPSGGASMSVSWPRAFSGRGEAVEVRGPEAHAGTA